MKNDQLKNIITIKSQILQERRQLNSIQIKEKQNELDQIHSKVKINNQKIIEYQTKYEDEVK